MSSTGNIVNFPDRSPIEDEAARWVLRHDNGALTPAEQAQFEAWKQASPAHADAFARLSGHWNDLDILAGLADTPAEQPFWRRPQLWAGVIWATRKRSHCRTGRWSRLTPTAASKRA